MIDAAIASCVGSLMLFMVAWLWRWETHSSLFDYAPAYFKPKDPEATERRWREEVRPRTNARFDRLTYWMRIVAILLLVGALALFVAAAIQ